jgi:hypothetical protein
MQDMKKEMLQENSGNWGYNSIDGGGGDDNLL